MFSVFLEQWWKSHLFGQASVEKHQSHRGNRTGEALGIELTTGDDVMAFSYFLLRLITAVRRCVD